MAQTFITTTYTSDEFKELLSECVAKTLREEVRPVQDHEPIKQILTRQETANLLNITLPTLSDYTKRGLIISNRIGSRVMYKLEDIQSALKQTQTTNRLKS